MKLLIAVEQNSGERQQRPTRRVRRRQGYRCFTKLPEPRRKWTDRMPIARPRVHAFCLVKGTRF